ncbi:FusB/FusC family EF-G-binding protein [Ornithinibacillus salinisoli]|uniref:FusB/FusC family EF-G-binding protein n=1 Tax=Ornithinibacillus salinisoli TaxID=1848459 RepID=A0ABW4VSX8_9BACI
MDNKRNTLQNDELFIRSDQYNFIKFQVNNLVHAHTTVKDNNVLHALKYSAFDKVMNLFPDSHENKKDIFHKIIEIEESAVAEEFLTDVKTYVIPFKEITDKKIQKLFPKAKKLKVPPLDKMDFKELSYIGWYDIRSERKYLIFDYQDRLIGIQGTFTESIQGICSLCNSYEDVGLFMSNVKSGKETYTNRGNYICKDSQTCNQNIITLDKLNNFISILKK